MKVFLLFLVFFFIGLAIMLSMHYLDPQQLPIGYNKQGITTKFSLSNAPTESLKGTIATVSGNVSWVSRTESKPVRPKVAQTIQQGEELSTGSNGKTVLRIQNDSLLVLSSNTHVSIIQLLPQNFVFVQDKGSILYENSIQVPISVKSLDLVTLITKGIATVTVDPNVQTVAVAVKTGIVKEGYEDLQNTSNVVTVSAGQTFVFDETNRTGTVQ